jgi:hypothetical protein
LLALEPLAPDAAPLDAGERFALDLLLDLSCVLRTDAAPSDDVVRLRVAADRTAPMHLDALRAGAWPRVADGVVLLDRAVLALVRDVAGAVAEQRSAQRDAHGRVPSTANALVAGGGEGERDPIVSQGARALAGAVQRAAGRRPAFELAPWPGGRRWAAALTHDLDVVEWWPAFTALRLAELASKGEVARALSVMGAVVASGGRDVVWRGVQQVLATEAQHGLRSSWFVLCGSPTLATARAGDLTYRPDGPRARRILSALAGAGHEVGLHGSFATSDAPALFGEQRDRLAPLARGPVHGVRQHYLRMHYDATPVEMQRAGFAYDSTVGFADRNGFRLGVADVVPSWSDARQSALELDEAPFCWMDRALSKYRGVESPDAWIDDALELAGRCAAVQGMWNGIWHPNLTPALGFPGAPEAYARLVSGLVSLGAFVAPLGELVEWRRRRRGVRAAGIHADGRPGLAGAAADIVVRTPAGEGGHAER